MDIPGRYATLPPSVSRVLSIARASPQDIARSVSGVEELQGTPYAIMRSGDAFSLEMIARLVQPPQVKDFVWLDGRLYASTYWGEVWSLEELLTRLALPEGRLRIGSPPPAITLGVGLSMLAKFGCHRKAITAIVLSPASTLVYSGSKDGTVRFWDCSTGQRVCEISLKCKIGSLISEGPWLCAGIPNAVKAWNMQTLANHTLNGPVGQVSAMVVGKEMLFAGAQSGVIQAWKFSSETNPFQLTASLEGHRDAVVSLAVSNNMMYSGSKDCKIKVWDIDTLQCVRTLNEHTADVTYLLCWGHFLLSGSLDQTVKIWGATEDSNLEVKYTHKESHGVIALYGMDDVRGKPILFCSCEDDCVRLYELPWFTEIGKIFAKRVRAIQSGPGGLFYIGDGTGEVSQWKWLEEPSSSAS